MKENTSDGKLENQFKMRLSVSDAMLVNMNPGGR